MENLSHETDETHDETHGDTKPLSTDSENEELDILLNQNEQISRKNDNKNDQEDVEDLESYIQEVVNDLNIFLYWSRGNINEKDFYQKFLERFDAEYRITLFKYIYEFFQETEYVSTEILFYWKIIAISLLEGSKKYKNEIDSLTWNLEKQETNLFLVKEKYIFRCFIDEFQICYFKENGTDYYVS